MGKIVKLDEFRLLRKEQELDREQENCQRRHGVSNCAECLKIGECEIHLAMVRVQHGDPE